MGIQKHSYRVEPQDQGKRLDQFLAGVLPGLSKAKVRKLIVVGAVYLNRKRVKIASKPVFNGAQIEVYLDPQKLSQESPSRDRPFEMTEKDVLFEDDDLIVVNKPALLPTQPTLDQARHHLVASVKKFLLARHATSGGDGLSPYLGLHHRLDRDTSGAVLFTKTKKINPGVAKLFKEHKIQKTYLALVKNTGSLHEGQSWEVKNFLGPLKSKSGKQTRQGSVHKGGQFAHTLFRVIKIFQGAALVEAKPVTGRMHQIRVHLSEQGLPILGDPLYGDSSENLQEFPRTFLHAKTLEFTHPLTHQQICVESPLPEDFKVALKSGAT